MKNIFSRKHDSQAANSKPSKNKLYNWISGSSAERTASRPQPVETDNTGAHMDLRKWSRAPKSTNPPQDKPLVPLHPTSSAVERGLGQTTKTNIVPQATYHQPQVPPRATSSRYRGSDDSQYQPNRMATNPGYPSQEREDRAKTSRHMNEPASAARPDVWLPQPSSKQFVNREQAFHEEAERLRRNEDSNRREGNRDKPRTARDRHRDEFAVIPERHTNSNSQRPRDRDKERTRDGDNERIRDKEREKEREKTKEKEREKKEKDRERERQREYEREKDRREKEEREREKQKEYEKERERERQKEYEREKEREHQREHEREKERERQREHEREKERERQREHEREKERERQREYEREKERERQREHEREKERERQREYEREKERERQREHEREKERERQREHEREKERERQKAYEREKRERERERKEKSRDKLLEQDRRDQEDRDRERTRRERDKEQEEGVKSKHSVPNLHIKARIFEGDVAHRDAGRVDEVTRQRLHDRPAEGVKIVKERPQPRDRQQDQVKIHAEATDDQQDHFRPKTRLDHKRRREGKSGLLSDSHERGMSRHPLNERPVPDDEGNTSDCSVDVPPAPQRVSRRDDDNLPTTTKVPQPRQSAGTVNHPGSGNQNQPVLPPYATPRVALTHLPSGNAVAIERGLPLTSNMVNIGTLHDVELARREINRTKLNNREDMDTGQHPIEAPKPIEPPRRPASRASVMQGPGLIPVACSQRSGHSVPQVMSSTIAPYATTIGIMDSAKERQHVRAPSADLKVPSTSVERPVDVIVQGQDSGRSRLRPGNGKDLPTEESKEPPSFPTRYNGYSLLNGQKEKKEIPETPKGSSAPPVILQFMEGQHNRTRSEDKLNSGGPYPVVSNQTQVNAPPSTIKADNRVAKEPQSAPPMCPSTAIDTSIRPSAPPTGPTPVPRTLISATTTSTEKSNIPSAVLSPIPPVRVIPPDAMQNMLHPFHAYASNSNGNSFQYPNTPLAPSVGLHNSMPSAHRRTSNNPPFPATESSNVVPVLSAGSHPPNGPRVTPSISSSSETINIIASPPQNALPNVRIHASNGNVNTPVQKPVDMPSPIPELTHQVARVQEVRQNQTTLARNKPDTNSPSLPKNKDESMVKDQHRPLIQVSSTIPVSNGNAEEHGQALQRPPTRSHVTRLPFPPTSVSTPSAPEVQNQSHRYEDIVPPRPNIVEVRHNHNPLHVIRPGRESYTSSQDLVSVALLIKRPPTAAADRIKDSNLQPTVASLDIKTWEKQLVHLDNQFGIRDSIEHEQAAASVPAPHGIGVRKEDNPAVHVSLYPSFYASPYQTQSQETRIPEDRNQEVNEHGQTGLSSSRPRSSSGAKKHSNANFYAPSGNNTPLMPQSGMQEVGAEGKADVGIPPKRKDPSDPRGLANEPFSDNPSRAESNKDQDAASSTVPPTGGELKRDSVVSPLPVYPSSVGSNTAFLHNHQAPVSGFIQIDGSPKHSVSLQHNAKSQNVTSRHQFVEGTKPTEHLTISAAGVISHTLADTAPFTSTSGGIRNDVTSSSEESGLKQESPSARQRLANTPVIAQVFLPSSIENPKKHPSGSPTTQNHNVAISSEPSRAPEFRETASPNVIQVTPPMKMGAGPKVESEFAKTPPEIIPQIRIRHPIGVTGVKEDVELTNPKAHGHLVPNSGGVPTTSSTSFPQQSMPDYSTTATIRAIRAKASLSRVVGGDKDDSQQRHRLKKSPETKFQKVEGAPFAGSAKVNSNDPEDSGRRKLKGSPPRVSANVGEDVAKHEAPLGSAKTGDTELLQSARLATQQLPAIVNKTEFKRDIPHSSLAKIQHPVLAELLSSGSQTLPTRSTHPIPAHNDAGYTVPNSHAALTNPASQPRPQVTPPQRPKPELDQKPLYASKEVASTSQAGFAHSHGRNPSFGPRIKDLPTSPFQAIELDQQPSGVQTAQDGGPPHRPLFLHSNDQVVHDQRSNHESPVPPQLNHTQEASPARRGSQMADFQTENVIPSRDVRSSQPQHAHVRPHHSAASLPTSSTPAVSYPPQAPAPVKLVSGTVEKPAASRLRAPSEETILMTPSSLAPTLDLKQTVSRQSNAESVNSQTSRKGLFSRFRRPHTPAPTVQAYEVWHPDPARRSPESNSGPSNNITAPLESKTTLPKLRMTSDTPQPMSVPVPTGKAEANFFTPFKLISKKKRSLSVASMEARAGTAPSTVVGSPTASMHSTTPLPPPPMREPNPKLATREWIKKEEDHVQARPRRRRHRPGVVFDTDEDAPEDKQRPRRNPTKYRNSRKRHEPSDS